VLAGLALVGCFGCPAVSNLPAPGALITQREPDLGHAYHLYVPSYYNQARQWALVVTCHGTPPFDTASAQIEEWKGLAEQKGFIVAAPELTGTSAISAISDQVGRQSEDEGAILSLVSSVRASRSIDDTRIFLTGWSAGGYAVLYTGLRHPDVFRALAVRQGNFDPAYVEPCLSYLDRLQPILIMYGNIDPLKDEALACAEWLKAHDLQPTVIQRPGAHRRDPQPVYAFFAESVRDRPWIRVHVSDDSQDPMHVRFDLKCSFEPKRYLWDFGDEQRSPVAGPDHRYAQPGTYNVRVAVYAANDKPYVRQIQVKVPRVRLGAKPQAAVPSSQAAQ
jgi:pimeloyl-ACP methyl ester carboxylesterase